MAQSETSQIIGGKDTHMLHRMEIQILLVDKTERRLLVDHFKLKGKEKDFSNSFFDTEKLSLFNAGAAFRARHYAHSDEYKLSLLLNDKDRERDQLVLGPLPISGFDAFVNNPVLPEGILLRNLNKIIDGDMLIYLGDMIVQRNFIETDYGYVKIDQNTFPSGYTDYELKISIKAGMEELANEIFHKELCVPFGLTPDPFTISKYDRYIRDRKK